VTEEKKKMRRKVLAKWLKESILRLGPTSIKIGQQFSTRVDILPQEYVDQLSELQVCVLNLILIVDMLCCFSI
jgi:predicted unusual protein kinase regulating ubiquinone biosynthesis (AarF/ABC1/UbiB family)